MWNHDTRTWELGEETGPVRTNEQFVGLTPEKLEELGCDAEVEGEQGEVVRARAARGRGQG